MAHGPNFKNIVKFNGLNHSNQRDTNKADDGQCHCNVNRPHVCGNDHIIITNHQGTNVILFLASLCFNESTCQILYMRHWFIVF